MLYVSQLIYLCQKKGLTSSYICTMLTVAGNTGPMVVVQEKMLDCIISITFRNEVQDIVIKEKEERILKACACCQERILHETSLGLVH